jgi:hypothetical protein
MVGAAAWSTLAPEMRRRFEPGHGPAVYRGTMRLERSAIGLVFARLAGVFGGPLPAQACDAANTVVSVRPEAGGVVWERRLGGRVIRSVKRPGPGGALLERTAGGLGMALDVFVEDGALVFASRGFFLCLGRLLLPVPALLTPGRCRVEHTPAGEHRFRFTLTMTHPLWGTTFRQSGVFNDPQELVR